MANKDEKIIWRTIGGRRVPIKAGQSREDAVRDNGVFDDLKKKKNAVEAFGKAYTEYSGKPDEAIEKLLKEKSGYVPAAIHKEDIGDIDFVWGKGGKDGFGLAHIIERRNEQGVGGEGFVRQIPNIIRDGDVMKGKYSDRVFVSAKNQTAVIRLDYDGSKAIWLVTAYLTE